MTLATPTIRASESGHWYTRDGVPQYTVDAKKGGQRNTTLRDARTMDLVPSVTTILGVAAKPALIAWLQQQVLLAALTLPRRENESETDYVSRIISDSKEQGRTAADEGTAIHASIQGHYEGKTTGRHPEMVAACVQAIDNWSGSRQWISERSFAHEAGYGGKCDLYCAEDGGIVVDIKTKEFADPDKVIGYDDNLMQLAAYRVGLGVPDARCANVFVSRNVPGLVVVKEWTPEECDTGWEMFAHLMCYWQLKNKHK